MGSTKRVAPIDNNMEVIRTKIRMTKIKQRLNKEFTDKIKGNLCQSSITSRENVPTADVKPKSDASEPFCYKCGQHTLFCHQLKHEDFCIKKLLFEYKNEMDLVTNRKIETSFKEAYNESRRADIFRRFNFYDGTVEDIPGCLLQAQEEMIHMIENMRIISINNLQSKKGITEFVMARGNREC